MSRYNSSCHPRIALSSGSIAVMPSIMHPGHFEMGGVR